MLRYAMLCYASANAMICYANVNANAMLMIMLMSCYARAMLCYTMLMLCLDGGSNVYQFHVHTKLNFVS